jgi:hypothetical protein
VGVGVCVDIVFGEADLVDLVLGLVELGRGWQRSGGRVIQVGSANLNLRILKAGLAKLQEGEGDAFDAQFRHWEGTISNEDRSN